MNNVKFCSECKLPLSEGTGFCTSCGASVAGVAPQTVKDFAETLYTDSLNKKKAIIAALSVVLIATMMLGWFAFGTRADYSGTGQQILTRTRFGLIIHSFYFHESIFHVFGGLARALATIAMVARLAVAISTILFAAFFYNIFSGKKENTPILGQIASGLAALSALFFVGILVIIQGSEGLFRGSGIFAPSIWAYLSLALGSTIFIMISKNKRDFG